MNTIIIDTTVSKEKLIDFIEAEAVFTGLKDDFVSLHVNYKTKEEVENNLPSLIVQAKEKHKINLAKKELDEIQHEDMLAMISEIYNRGMSRVNKNLVNPEIKKKLDDLDQNEIIKERLARKNKLKENINIVNTKIGEK